MNVLWLPKYFLKSPTVYDFGRFDQLNHPEIYTVELFKFFGYNKWTLVALCIHLINLRKKKGCNLQVHTYIYCFDFEYFFSISSKNASIVKKLLSYLLIAFRKIPGYKFSKSVLVLNLLGTINNLDK